MSGDGVSPFATHMRYPFCENCITDEYNNYKYINCGNCRIKSPSGYLSGTNQPADGACMFDEDIKVGLFGSTNNPRMKCCKNGSCRNAITSTRSNWGNTDDGVRCFTVNSVRALKCMQTCPKGWPWRGFLSSGSDYLCYADEEECKKQCQNCNCYNVYDSGN